MNNLVICTIVSFFVATMFFIATAIDFVHYLEDLQKEKENRLSPGGTLRVVFTDYYFRNFVVYTLGGVIAALIGFDLLKLNRRPDVISSRT